MIFLALSILCSTINHLLFKAFQRLDIAVLPAIVVNYLVCIGVGFLAMEGAAAGGESIDGTLLVFAVFQGALLIGSFFLMSATTRKNGVGVAALAARLSVILPTVTAFFLYGDSAHGLKLAGIGIAVVALYLSSFEKRAPEAIERGLQPISVNLKAHADGLTKTPPPDPLPEAERGSRISSCRAKKFYIPTYQKPDSPLPSQGRGAGGVRLALVGLQPLPILLFLSFGMNLVLAKYVQVRHLDRMTYHGYLMYAFGFAFLSGLGVLIYRLARGRTLSRRKDIIAGVLLGVNNYGSLYFMIRAIAQPGWESSVVFPTISASVVMLSFVGAFMIFGERASRRKLAALAVGVAAIVLINSR